MSLRAVEAVGGNARLTWDRVAVVTRGGREHRSTRSVVFSSEQWKGGLCFELKFSRLLRLPRWPFRLLREAQSSPHSLFRMESVAVPSPFCKEGSVEPVWESDIF